jgi:alpha-mannosidase
MSRSDIPERRGHAGWPTPTPEARTFGAVHGRLAVMLHGPAKIDSRELLEAAAEAFLAPPIALMRRALLAAPPEVRGPALSGEGLVFSAMKPAESGRGTILRCYNGRDKAASGAWHVAWRVTSATLCRLDEGPLKKLRVERGGTIRFDAPPRGVVTVLLR